MVATSTTSLFNVLHTFYECIGQELLMRDWNLLSIHPVGERLQRFFCHLIARSTNSWTGGFKLQGGRIKHCNLSPIGCLLT